MAQRRTIHTKIRVRNALLAGVEAAQAAGKLMRTHLNRTKKADLVTQHDIKLELDVRCQKLIERRLRSQFPQVSLLGEEGDAGLHQARSRWVVDPIDGTVNFAYGIPHACVSIALQEHFRATSGADYADGYRTLLGVVYDPFADELWTAIRGERARLNGKVIRVSRRRRLEEAIVSIGFSKTRETLEATLPYFNKMVRRVRKVRIMGAAALALTYVAMGRFDAHIERSVRLWDIAAGGLIVECAGGEFWQRPASGDHVYQMIASNGRLRGKLTALQ
jgi:myo-inositol-1(or 4)-monophosphatase